MKRLIYLLAAGAMALSSCGPDEGSGGEKKDAKGNVFYGDVLKMNEVEDFRSLYPLDVTEVTSQRIANQIYEGLVRLSQADLKVIPGLAEKWEKNADATVWTFYLRQNASFHDDECFPDGKGRAVTAEDFKYSFDKLCESKANNQQFYVTFKDRVQGANEYFESTAKGSPMAGGVSGVKVLDPYTLQITLNFPFAGFDNILTMPGCWVFPKEAVDKYGENMRTKCVGTGPFRVKTIEEGNVVVLERNNNYWATDEFGNQLPYLDGVKFTFIKEKKQEMLAFRQGEVDMIFRIPTEMHGQILSEFKDAKGGNTPFVLQMVPAMSLTYYGFQNQGQVFNNKKVRQAFNYAIDRDKIIGNILKGEGIAGKYGMVPPVDNFSDKGYEFEKLKGYSFEPDMARKLLADAGFPNGKGFPSVTLQINSGGADRNVLTAQLIQSQLKEVLNINVEIDMMPFAQHLDKLETGKTDFWRTGWIADYPDPETFLTILYGTHVPAKLEERSSVNSVRFLNARFDSLFGAAMREVDDKRRYDLYLMADQVALEEAAYMPIFYEENYRLVQNWVKNFDANAMEYRDMTRVFVDPKIKGKFEKGKK
ncbi:MAG: ABC transporter substrate-binding protein [Bacteroidia bacterium]|nr:ABC transporter substrate-binding protein [Bacteroidia bacterium]